MLGKYEGAFERIKRESMSHSTYKVIIFVACMDVDAMMAAMMLATLLKKHLILYKIEPVIGYDSLKRGFDRLDTSIRNVFLIGCGATIDIEELFQLEDNEDNEHGAESRPRPTIHVFDRNLPWHLNNLFGSDTVYCYGAELDSEDRWKSLKQAYMFLANPPDPEEPSRHYEDRWFFLDTDSEKDEYGTFSDSDAEPTQKIRENQLTQKIIDSDGSEDESADPRENTQEDDVQLENSIDERPSKRQRTGLSHSERRHALRTKKARRILEDYYRSDYYLRHTNTFLMTSFLMFSGGTSEWTNWLAIIGFTSFEAQDYELYEKVCSPMNYRPMDPETAQRLLMQRKADLERRYPGDTRLHNELDEVVAAVSAANRTRTLQFIPGSDYSLFLLRQWSLYESMIHSSYVSAKLFLWREDGRKKLHKMLARVGIPLQDARESWIHMKPSLKRELKAKLDSISGYYGIEKLTRDGVIRQFGFAGSMSAGDCVESISAYMEMGKPQRGIVPTALTSAGSSASIAAASSSNTDGGDADEDGELSESWVRNFWTAWDAVDNYDRLREGAEQAKMLQRAVVSTANFIFDKNLPKDLHSFRMVIVQEAPDLAVFLNPLSLRRLAVWICEACAELHTSDMPFVLAVLNEQRNVYLVLGLAGNESRDYTDDDVRNKNKGILFGRPFQETAVEINARVRVDAFDSSIIEVAREDLPRFFEALDLKIRAVQDDSQGR